MKLTCISIDLLMIAIYVIVGLLFIKSKGKGCNFISGYNMKNSEERKTYDEVKVCKYFGKTILVWATFFIIGAIVDYFASPIGLMIAFLLLIFDFAYFIIYIRIKKFDEKFKISK